MAKLRQGEMTKKKPTTIWRCRLSAAGKRSIAMARRYREGDARQARGGYIAVRWDGNATFSTYHRDFIERIDPEVRNIEDILSDCVALLRGDISGDSQRDGILQEADAILGRRQAESRRVLRQCRHYRRLAREAKRHAHAPSVAHD